MGGVAEPRLVHVARELLGRLRQRRRHSPVAVLQARRGLEGIGRYRRGCASVACPARVLPIVLVARHLRASLRLVVLRRRVLVGIGGRVWHCNGSGGLDNGREYLSHRFPRRYGWVVSGRYTPAGGSSDGCTRVKACSWSC